MLKDKDSNDGNWEVWQCGDFPSSSRHWEVLQWPGQASHSPPPLPGGPQGQRHFLQLKGDKPVMFLFSHKKKPLEYLVILISLNKGLREEQTGGGGGDVEAGGGQRGGGHWLVQEGLEGGQTDQGWEVGSHTESGQPPRRQPRSQVSNSHGINQIRQ